MLTEGKFISVVIDRLICDWTDMKFSQYIKEKSNKVIKLQLLFSNSWRMKSSTRRVIICGYQQETMIDTNSRRVRATGDRFDMEDDRRGKSEVDSRGPHQGSSVSPSCRSWTPSKLQPVNSCQKFDMPFYHRRSPPSFSTIFDSRPSLVSLTS